MKMTFPTVNHTQGKMSYRCS